MPGVQVGVGYIDIKPDLSGFSRELKARVGKDMETAGDDAGKKLGSSLGSSIKGALAGFGAALIGAKIGGFFKDAIGAASNLAESVNKSNVVFGASGQVIAAWAEGAAQNIGLSKQAAFDAAGTFGNMFSQLGIGSEQAASLSVEMVNLAADFASFHNANIEDVITAQTAAFRGEYDALQRFLPTINAANVEQRALAMTGKRTTKELTAQEKALAVNKLMMEGAGAAAGDFARTSDGLANTQRILNAEWANAKTELGEGMLPAMTATAGFLNDELIPGFKTLFSGGGDAEGWAATISNVVGDTLGFLAGVLQQTLRFFANAISKLPFGWGDEMASDFREAADAGDGFRDRMHATKGELLEWEGATRNADLATKLLTPTLNGATKAVADQSKAIRESSKATRDAAANDRSLRQAKKDLADLIKEGAVDDKKVADARKSLAEATRSAAAADRDLADAQEEYDEAKAAADILGTDTALEAAEDAADGLADATENSASAHEAATEAALALAEAQRGDPEFQDKLAAARDKVADAQDKVTTAEEKTLALTGGVVQSIGSRAEAVKLLNDELGITAGHLGVLNDGGNILSGLTSKGATPGILPPPDYAARVAAPGSPMTQGFAPAAAPAPTKTVQVDMTVLGPAPDPTILGKAIAWAI